MRPLFERHAGVINFPAGSTGVQMGGWFKNEVYTEDDFRQVTMRIPGLGAEVLNRMGVKTVELPATAIQPAFAEGRIDAAEFVGPYDDEKLGLHKLAEFYYYPGWWEPGTTNDAYVNLERWRELSREDQALFETACRAAHSLVVAEYDAKNHEALQRLRDGGTQLRLFNDRILAPARRAAEELHREKAAANTEYAEVYQQWNAFRSNINRWHWHNEISYMNSVIREFSP
jgi:TRAP-type mannitol/chloroaromatic compound transport system substrate-binding protein